MRLVDRLKRLLGRGNGDAGHSHPSEDSTPPMISCRDALTVLYEYLDGELEGASQEQVKAHFDVCSRCYPHLRLEESFRAALRRAGQGETAPDQLKERLQELITEADAG